MNPALIPVIGKVINTVSNTFKNKHEIDNKKIQNERIKEQNRHESDMNKDDLIKKGVENLQKNLKKSQSNEDTARQQEYEARESEKDAYGKMLRRTEVLLESKMDNTEKYLNKILEIRETYLDEKEYMLNSIYDEKDKSFNQALSIMNNIVNDGMEAFGNFSEHRETIEEINRYKILISKKNNEISDEVIVTRSDVSRLKIDLIKEEAKYDQLIELKCSLNNKDFKIKFGLVSASMLKIANKLNNKEILLIKKEHENNNSDEKLLIINNQLRSIERKEFDALSSIKANFYAQKIIHNMSFHQMIQSDGNIEVLENEKSSDLLVDNIDIRLQSDNIKRLEH